MQELSLLYALPTLLEKKLSLNQFVKICKNNMYYFTLLRKLF